MVKNPPTNAGDTGDAGWIFLGWEDSLEEEMATHSSILAWKSPWTEEPGGYSPWGHKESDTTEQLSTAHNTNTKKKTLMAGGESMKMQCISSLRNKV